MTEAKIQMAVWMDHHEARVFRVESQSSNEPIVEWAAKHVHRHAKDSELKEHHHPDDEHRFFRQVTGLIEGADEVLVLGPSVTKLKFVNYVHDHQPALKHKIVGIESAAHPTDKQIVAHVREYFHLQPPRYGVGGAPPPPHR